MHSFLWGVIRKQLSGYEVKLLSEFICNEKKLIIEINGGQHNEDKNIIYGQEWTNFFETKGDKVIRFWNSDIENNLDGVYLDILKHLDG